MTRRLFAVLTLTLGLVLGLTSAVGADFKDGTVNISELSANPASASYSPYAWTSTWSPEKNDLVELQGTDTKKGLIDAGLVIGDGESSEQWDALTAEEQAQLQTEWKSGLLKYVWSLAMERKKASHSVASGDDVYVAPEWSAGDADAAAQLLGGADYASLTPGLKGVVQRIAVIVTGDNKPPMPDDQWQSWMPAGTKADFDAMAATRYSWERNIAFNVDPGPDGVTRACDPDYPTFVVSFCQTVQAGVGAAEDVAGAVTGAVEFVSDPIGWLNQKMAEGASAVFEWVATTANTATMPDLTNDWWISAYEKGMAAGLIIFFLVLMWQFVQVGRGQVSQAEFLDAWKARVPAFAAGLAFGPPIAQFMIVGAGQLTDDIVSGMTGSTGEATEAITAAITAAGTGNILGGAIIAMVILLVLIVACFFIFIALCTQTVAIYMSGAVFAIAFAWIADARRSGGSMKVPLIFLGLVFSRPLLFFLLSIGMGMIGSAFSGEADGGAKELGMLVMAVVLLCMVALSPMLLLQLAPVIPTGAGPSGGGGSTGGGGAAPRGGGGSSGGGSALQQLARPSAAAAAAGSAGGGASAGGSPGGGPAGDGPAGGGSPTGPGSGGAGGRGGGSGGKASGTSAAAKPPSSGVRAGADAAAGGTGLSRSRRHGGGAPSPAAAAMLAGSSGSNGSEASGTSQSAAGRPGGRGAGGAAGLGSKVRAGARKAQQPLANAAQDMGGGKPW